jgi:hypothetical protein
MWGEWAYLATPLDTLEDILGQQVAAEESATAGAGAFSPPPSTSTAHFASAAE